MTHCWMLCVIASREFFILKVPTLFCSQKWRTWAACFIQAAWRHYLKRKRNKAIREAEDTLGEAVECLEPQWRQQNQITKKIRLHSLLSQLISSFYPLKLVIELLFSAFSFISTYHLPGLMLIIMHVV